jgi:hypothetical protein
LGKILVILAQHETNDIFLSLLTEAYTGCRISEIADSNTRDFNFVKNGDLEKVIPGQWFLFIGEDNREPGCTIKGTKPGMCHCTPRLPGD